MPRLSELIQQKTAEKIAKAHKEKAEAVGAARAHVSIGFPQTSSHESYADRAAVLCGLTDGAVKRLSTANPPPQSPTTGGPVEDKDENDAVAKPLKDSDGLLKAIQYAGLKAKKRNRPADSDADQRQNPFKRADASSSIGQQIIPNGSANLTHPETSIKKTLAANDSKSSSFKSLPQQRKVNPYGPPPKAWSKTKQGYLRKTIVDTQRRPSDWYRNINMKDRYSRRNLQIIADVKRIVQNCIDTYKADVQTGGSSTKYEAQTSQLRTKLHQMEFLDFQKEAAILIKKSKVLEEDEPGGLTCIFVGKDSAAFPWDIRCDAEALWYRWMAGDVNPDLMRGIVTEKGELANGKKHTAHKLDKNYTKRVAANVVGDNGFYNGQWWPRRICAWRDGAHGELEAGISGLKGKGAVSLVISNGGYADEDHGDTVEYCGTASSTDIPSAYTSLMIEAQSKNQPVRVLRAANKTSKYAPKIGIRYDGLYEIIDREVLDAPTAMHRFSLKRLENQDPIRYKGVEIRPTDQEIAEEMKLRNLFA